MKAVIKFPSQALRRTLSGYGLVDLLRVDKGVSVSVLDEATSFATQVFLKHPSTSSTVRISDRNLDSNTHERSFSATQQIVAAFSAV
jgi:hypothetical protein